MTVADKFRAAREIVFLVECDFNGLIKRYADKDIAIDGDHFFDGQALSIGSVGTTFNLKTFTLSMGSVGVTIANKDRLQDEETRRVLDGSICNVYAYCDGMTWAETISDGLIYTGTFRKEYNCLTEYSFTIEEATLRRMRMMPEAYVNDDTFSAHRKAGGAGSVSGKPVPVVFGEFDGGIPLICIDTSGYKYAVAHGIVKSTDADFTATTENVRDKDGSVVAAAGYTFYPSAVGSIGPYAYFDFTSDQAASEKLSCSIKGTPDGGGLITGTGGQLIEHPAHIYHYLVDQYGIDIGPHLESIGTMALLLPNVKYAVYVNDIANAADVCRRVLGQSLCSMAIIKGKFGVMTFDPGATSLGSFTVKNHHIGRRVQISKTDIESVCNKLTVNYSLNIGTGQYEGQLSFDRFNNDDCKLSYHQYGERPEVVLDLPDVRTVDSATFIAKRYLSVHSFRHDIVPLVMGYGDGWDLREGSAASWTVPSGASADGNGWIDEKMILLDRSFTRSGIRQRWWRVNTK